jgi:hypothetical protein
MPHEATHLAGATLAQLHLVDALLTLRAADAKLALAQEGRMQPGERARRRVPERHEDALALTVAEGEDRGVGVESTDEPRGQRVIAKHRREQADALGSHLLAGKDHESLQSVTSERAALSQVRSRQPDVAARSAPRVSGGRLLQMSLE